eukprot:scaffold2636_cov340-Pavlova_lutheri.AAC.59
MELRWSCYNMYPADVCCNMGNGVWKVQLDKKCDRIFCSSPHHGAEWFSLVASFQNGMRSLMPAPQPCSTVSIACPLSTTNTAVHHPGHFASTFSTSNATLAIFLREPAYLCFHS